MSRTLILGAGVSGRAAARLANRLGHEVTVYDRDETAAAAIEGAAIRSGPWDADALAGQDLVVTSPGIPEGAAPVVDSLASGVEFISEMEFGFRHLAAPCAAVTGTNGKTTVTTATADMLLADGFDAVAAGNIGLALSDTAGAGHDVVVVEASSFQLQYIDRFHPRAAAILNIAPDHLDWHSSIAGYAAAKRRIGERQTREDIIVFDIDDAGAKAAVAGLPGRHVPVSGSHRPPGGNGPDGSVLYIGELELARPKLDAAYTMDIAAAATLARHMGAGGDAIAATIAKFTTVTHRRTEIGTWDGVQWINDSKATNPHAALAAVRGYPSVILIAGGRNKGLDLSQLPVQPSVRAVIGIGEASPELAAAAPGKFHEAASLDQAVALADDLASSGDTVLLAPGCASFDMFDDYTERGRRFTELVLERKG